MLEYEFLLAFGWIIRASDWMRKKIANYAEDSVNYAVKIANYAVVLKQMTRKNRSIMQKK